MGQALTSFREEPRRSSENEFGLKNALARIVRNRWRTKTIEAVMAEWGLTDGEARGVVYAQASQRTLDKIIKHKRGGWSLYLDMGAEVIGHALEQHITQEQGRLAHERAAFEQRERQLIRMAGDLLSLRGVGDHRRDGLRD